MYFKEVTVDNTLSQLKSAQRRKKMATSSWIPWGMLLSMLPAGAADLVKEEERERRREEIVRWLQELSRLVVQWSVRIGQVCCVGC